MIIYWWHPLGFLGAWLSVDLVCWAVLARQNHRSKLIQQAGLFCRLYSEEAWGKLAHSLLLPLFSLFSTSQEHVHFSSLRFKKESLVFPASLPKTKRKLLGGKKKSTLCSPAFPFCRKMVLSPSHDMFNVANIHVLLLYAVHPKFLSFLIHRTSSCAECCFSLNCPNSLIYQPWLFEPLYSLWLF